MVLVGGSELPESTVMIVASTLVDRATELVEAIGLAGVALLIALESVFPPIPSELVLLLTGFQVSTGEFGFVAAVVAATVGSVLGALVLYAFGALVGEERLESILARVGRPLGIKRADVDRADAWWDRHGQWVVLFGRMVPLVRSLVSIPAGSNRMPLGRFCLFTALGSAAWNLIWIAIGRALGDRWEDAERWTGYLDAIVIVGLAGGLGWLVVRARRRRAAD